jgi:trimeric autotransporter adhesin
VRTLPRASALLLSLSLVASAHQAVPERVAAASQASAPEAQRSAATDMVATNTGDAWAALGSNGAGNGAINGTVHAVVAMGDLVFVGGNFTNAGGIAAADYIAGWNGTSWFALGSDGAGNGALKAPVRALGANDAELYVGGDFINAAGIAEADYVARWSPAAGWEALDELGSSPGLNGPVLALLVREGTVVIGGSFINAGGLPAADHIVRWSGQWHAMGGGANGVLNGPVRALAAWDDNVFAGGSFTDVGGDSTADRVARWNMWSNAWSSLTPTGSAGALNADVLALAVNSEQQSLFIGGAFVDAAGMARADYLVQWKAGAWSAVDASGTTGAALNGPVRALAVSDGLYVGGGFTDARGNTAADHVAYWDYARWSPVAQATTSALTAGVRALAVQPTKRLYVGGAFDNAAGIATADRIAVATIGPWNALGSNGAGNGALAADIGGVYAMLMIGDDLYVGGSFYNAGGIPEADRIARWDGTSWHALGSDGAGNGALVGYEVHALAVFNGQLIVGGSFSLEGVSPEVNSLARWDGTSWSAVGGLSGASSLDTTVTSLAVSGNNLYVGGGFQDLAGIPAADGVARWNGSNWSALGTTAAVSGVNAIAVDGSNVYVGGLFTDAAGITNADYLARWNGTAWSALGSNGAGNGALSAPVHALRVGNGQLYVGGEFQNAGGNADADRIARWNGSSWNSLGPGSSTGIVRAIEVVGSDVYAGGSGGNWAGIPEADAIAKWDGSRWSALGSNGAGNGAMTRLNATYTVHSLLAVGARLYAGGTFRDAAAIAEADYIAAYGPIQPAAAGALYQPDARIRKGTGVVVGDNIYDPNAGTAQTRTATVSPGTTVTFRISAENDGNVVDRYRIAASGPAVTGYVVRYWRGTTEITASVVAGTYLTPQLAPGSKHVIKAKVTVKSGAAGGSSVSRLVTVTSVAQPSAVDAVRFTVRRS